MPVPSSRAATTASQGARNAESQETALYKEWLIAKEVVSRCNRNLLQYAAGLATLLGIGGATTGVFALARSLRGDTKGYSSWLEYVGLVVGFILTLALTALIIKSLVGRRRAERDADEHLRQLPRDLLAKAIPR